MISSRKGISHRLVLCWEELQGCLWEALGKDEHPSPSFLGGISEHLLPL